jgi:hypothetical protein
MTRWADIVTECGNYKAGFVAIYLSHINEKTDEKDKYGRVVTVTEASFARHMGIPQQTFHDWVEREMVPESGSKSAKEERTAASHANVIKNMTSKNPTALVNAIMEAPTSAVDQAFHELKLRRAGVDTSKANKKAAEAKADNILKPIRRAMATVSVDLCVAALNEAAEDLQNAMEEGALTSDAMAQIDQAHQDFQNVLTEARFAVS